jgi:DNA polymerase-1
MDRPRLFLIDAFGFIFRAYHARARSGAPPMRTRAGMATEAVYIFHNMLRRLLAAHKPDHLAAVFEGEGPTFREQVFEAYKANRTETPPDLIEQIPWVRRLLEAMRIPVLSYAGFEADDVIGAMARQAEEAGLEVVVVSSDKDMLQLVGGGISMLNPMKDDEWYDAAKVKEFLGVEPSQVADLLALKGDASDNIPGAPGIGDKGARELIARFGSVEAALEGAASVERKMYRESLLNNRERILMSKRLATLDTSVPVAWSPEQFQVVAPDLESLRGVYRELEFFSFLKDLDAGGQKQSEFAAEFAGNRSLTVAARKRPVVTEPRASASGLSADYGTLETPEDLDRYLGAIPSDAPVAVAVTGNDDGGLLQGMVGLSWKPGEARGIGLEWVEKLRPLLEDPARPKVAHDVKSVLQALARAGVEAQGFGGDVMLYAFLLEADPAGCSLDHLVQRRLNRKLGGACEERAASVLELSAVLSREVDEQGFGELYRTMDLPLLAVLMRMERAGIRVDPVSLAGLSGRMETDIERLTGEIHALAGRPFNINSPQQLAKVLFEDLGLPSQGKKASTAADVLEELAAAHPIAAKVLEYRQLAKLKGTYVDTLPALIDPSSGRVHTSFNPTGAATGRLSSSNPNLQNIPIRTELGREIRAAFLPREGWKLLVADYSQIELRLLAHMSRDPVLLEAFRNGEDIHTRTAAEVFGVPPLLVPPEMRRNAKAVNFGIVYGQSAFGLAAQLGIPQFEAQKYIQGYFERYAGVKRFIDKQIAEVRRRGETRTLFGRRRPIPEINSGNANLRGFAERTAVNTPLQGSAADLIKLAMLSIDRELRARGARTTMLLQVHDELVFEAPPEEVEEIGRLVKREMEAAHPLEVPLIADIGVGDNWRDAK